MLLFNQNVDTYRVNSQRGYRPILFNFDFGIAIFDVLSVTNTIRYGIFTCAQELTL